MKPFSNDTITDDSGAVYFVGLGTVIQADDNWRVVDLNENSGDPTVQVVRMRHNIDDTLAASPSALLYREYSWRHFADAVLGMDSQPKFNAALSKGVGEAKKVIADMMSYTPANIAISLINTRESLLKNVKSIPGLSEGKLSDKFFMIVKTPYQVADKPEELPSRNSIDQYRLYEAHECDENGMLIAKENLKISFMLSDDFYDDSAVMQRPKIIGQRELSEQLASDGAYYSRRMEKPKMVWQYEL